MRKIAKDGGSRQKTGRTMASFAEGETEMEKRPLIWAHRGASGYAPENTLPAFRLAAEMGAEGVELDVQKTKDGQLVVCHDETVDRTASAKGRIRDYTLAELKKLDFCCGNLAYEGVRIPTLEEVLELLGPTGLAMNIELKTGIVFYERIEEQILDTVKAMGWRDRVIYSSFNHETLRTIRRLDPEAPTGVLYADGLVNAAAYGRSLGAKALHPAVYNLQYPGFFEECREQGMEVNVWTVNSGEELRYCGRLGVHAVITNYPDKARKILEEQ